MKIDREGNQLVLHLQESLYCQTTKDLVRSDLFFEVLNFYLDHLSDKNSELLESLTLTVRDRQELRMLLQALATVPLEKAATEIPLGKRFLKRGAALHQLIEGFYNYWRSYCRFMILHSEPGVDSNEYRPYRAFNATFERLNHLVLGLYRDVCENITGAHPRVYRQVAAGCTVGLITVSKNSGLSELSPLYNEVFGSIPFIRQVLIDPPLIIDPPMNTRSGQFQRVEQNPLDYLAIEPANYVCYPAQVGSLTIFVYFHQKFFQLGTSLANLFELATDEQVASRPDAIFVFGSPTLRHFGRHSGIFYEDEEQSILLATIPLEETFGYFGYLKKMILTLHNVMMMKCGRMPYHGAMTGLSLHDGRRTNVLLIGDTATGKSETLEALRIMDRVRRLSIVADDMGSLEIQGDQILAYGTETGAFVRLDDLQQGYAFGQIDRAIIMSPQKTNARAVLPVTTLDEILRGTPVDFLLYANNYEDVSDRQPILERFTDPTQALDVFRDGAAMAKGTTSSTGLVHNYFANVFGPPQYRDLHEQIAKAVFERAFQSGLYVGQLRTRLGIPGYESKGPFEAANRLLEAFYKNC